MFLSLFLLPLFDIWSVEADNDEDDNPDVAMGVTGASDEMDIENPSNNVRFFFRFKLFLIIISILD